MRYDMTVQQAADVLAVSTKTIRRRIADGTLPAHRVGPRLIRLRRIDLDRFAMPIGA
ncbi:excisionase family DNA-binding protein [Rhodococcus wratislaviensis]|uniref:excisionase family DNA-binding protein n=1 Tax=Rhodococcus wratislaviensis TaxID=44752 RepID=UPI00365D2FF5